MVDRYYHLIVNLHHQVRINFSGLWSVVRWDHHNYQPDTEYCFFLSVTLHSHVLAVVLVHWTCRNWHLGMDYSFVSCSYSQFKLKNIFHLIFWIKWIKSNYLIIITDPHPDLIYAWNCLLLTCHSTLKHHYWQIAFYLSRWTFLTADPIRLLFSHTSA